MERFRSVFIWIVVIGSAAIYFWLDENKQGDPTELSISEVPDASPDAVLTGMNLTRYNSLGVATLNAKAESLAIYNDTGLSFMEQPNVILLNDQEGQWQITSERAVIDDNEDIEFFTNVTTVQLDTTSPVTMTSDYMKILNQGRLVKTDRPVNIIRGAQIIDSLGMTINLETREPIVTLLSEVKFYYEP